MFFAITALLIFAVCFSCEEPISNERVNLKLKGKVKSIKETSFEAVEKGETIETGKRSKPSWKKDTYRAFKRNGELTEEIVYSSNGDMRSFSNFKSNTHENNIKESIFNSKGDMTFIQVWNLNDQGKLVEKLRFNVKGETLIRILYKYDKEGNLIEDSQYFDSSKEPRIKYNYVYDSKGNKVEEYMYNPMNELIAKWKSKYNEDDILVEEQYYYSDGSVADKETYTYEFDKKGNWVQQIIVANGTPKYVVQRDIKYY